MQVPSAQCTNSPCSQPSLTHTLDSKKVKERILFLLEKQLSKRPMINILRFLILVLAIQIIAYFYSSKSSKRLRKILWPYAECIGMILAVYLSFLNCLEYHEKISLLLNMKKQNGSENKLDIIE